MKYCMIECAFKNKEEVEKAVNILIDNHLIASAQVIESKSTWTWQKEKEITDEYLLIMKTKKTLLKDIYKEIRNIHSYDCFELAVFDLNSPNEEYFIRTIFKI